MKTFLIVLGLCTVTATGLMSLEDQVSWGSCDDEIIERRPGYVPNNQYPLHLALNYNKGAYLVFSDDRTYEIHPDDQLYSAFWITPFPPEFGESGDPTFPLSIFNPYSDRTVRAREVPTRQILREEKEETLLAPAPAPEPAQSKSQETKK